MKRIRKAVIPAAGLGTRFLPATKAQPKEMLPVVDKPAIQYVVEEAVRPGIDDILIITGRGKRALEDHFDRSFELEHELERDGQGRRAEPRCAASPSWPTSTTSARASRSASATPCRWPASTSATSPFVGDAGRRHHGTTTSGVLAGMIAAHEQHRRVGDRPQGGPARARSRRYGCAGREPVGDRRWSGSSTSSRSRSRRDAPSNLAVMGRYVLHAGDLRRARPGRSPGAGGEIQLTDAIGPAARRARPCYGYTFDEGRYDVGNKLDYLRATVELALDRDDLGPEFRAFLADLVATRAV